MKTKVKSPQRSERIDLMIDPETLEKLLKVVSIKYSSISEITRTAIREYLDKHLPKQ